jgi:hypothetical protein
MRAWPAVALLLALAAAPAAAQAPVLPPELLARLRPATERPLALDPGGDPRRFLAGDGTWEEARPPFLVDADGDGAWDFVIAVVDDEGSPRRAIIVHEWGEAAGRLGPAVFYAILDEAGDVTEWAGTPQPRPRRPAP